MVQPFRIEEFLKNFSLVQAVPPLSVYPRELKTKIHRNIGTGMLIAALFIILKNKTKISQESDR